MNKIALMAVATVVLSFFLVAFSIAGGIKCPCSGPLSKFTSVSQCDDDHQCSLDYSEKDYDILVNKLLYGRRIARNDLKRYFEPICYSIDAEAHQGEIALIAYDPLKVIVVTKSKADSYPVSTRKEFGTTMVLRFCSLRDLRSGDFSHHPCELQGNENFMTQTCWFRTVAEPSSALNGNIVNVGHYLEANFVLSVVLMIGITEKI